MSNDILAAEFFRHSLIAIPGQIDANIVRTAYSPLVYEYKDYAVGIVDSDGYLLSQSQGALPIFVANAIGVAAKDAIEIYGVEGLEPGDVLISNHAGTLGQHLNNVVMIAPVFVAGETMGSQQLFGFMAVIVHWIDIGGCAIGSGSLEATEIFQEGVQYRSVKIMRAGKRDPGLFATIRANSRFPRELMGDVDAQLAGCLKGGDMIQHLVARHGVKAARLAITRMWDAAEGAARNAILAIPDGLYEAESFLDDDGTPGSEPVRVAATVRIVGDSITIDLSGCADQTLGPLNSGREGGAVAAARIAFKYLIDPREPACEGSFRPLSVLVRDGTFLSANETAPMSFYSAPLPTVVDTILHAMVSAIPDRIAAGHHGTFGVHMFTGRHPETGALFQNLDTALGGWGASRGSDGGGPYKTMAHGDTLDVPIEAQEAMYPLLVEAFEIREDSGGAGEWRGGLGLKKVFVARGECRVLVAQDRQVSPPWGIVGGADGAQPETWLNSGADKPRRLSKANLPLQPGDRLTILSGGGGGFGNPRDRDRDLVRRDIADGYISSKAASTIYGLSDGEAWRS